MRNPSVISRVLLFAACATAAIALLPLEAQVTTATLYGVVQDATGAVIPGAAVTATNQGTGIARSAVTDERGEFALPALATGQYTIKIEHTGFKTLTNEGLQLGAAQTVRSTFVLDLGQVAENITVAGTAPLVESASAAQKEALGIEQVDELPVARRNLENLVVLAPGTSDNSVGIAGGGNIFLNGVAEGGNAITVDGTDAMANPETRGMSQYGGQSQTSIMSIDAVAEVQVIKGILPAEYGGVVGGQVNFLTRSGTNQFHGSAFENYQNEAFFARDTFLPPTSAKPKDRFNQFGGSLGGPILKDRLFFFTSYEGYRENSGVVVTGTVPTDQLKTQIQNALPFPETQIVLNTLPEPNRAINANVGQYTAAKQLTRHDNEVLVKGDAFVFGGNFSVTFSRMHPDTVNPQIYVNGANDQTFLNSQDRVAAQYVLSRGPWISETRFGWNQAELDRSEAFWFKTDPAQPALPPASEVGMRIPEFSVSGLFATPGQQSLLDLFGRSYSVEQKVSRVMGSHNLKAGFNWGQQGGYKNNPEVPNLTYQTIGDLLNNVPSTLVLQSGQPPHDGYMNEFGLFIQDDWRVNKRLVINAGLRWDFYPVVHIHATSNIPAEIYNLSPPSSLQALDFGAPRNPDSPYNPDYRNLGPRLGFAWTLDASGKTVLRGGTGVLYSQELYAMLQNTVSNPFLPSMLSLNKTQLAADGIKWPAYGLNVQNLIEQQGGGKPVIYSIIDTNLRNPYTVQTSIDVERQFGGSWMVEAGYFRTDGANFPLHDPFAQAFDRQTGAYPNPLIAGSAGYYITSGQTMVYNALQASVRKRFANNLGLEFHYTLEKGWSDQGGALGSNFVNGDIFVTQDFFNPYLDREPLSNEARHRVAANAVYMLPWLKDRRGIVKQAFSGWQVSSIITGQTGLPLRITQPSGIANSRPDFAGGDPTLANYRTTRLFLNKAAFALVPTSPVTGATLRAGTENPSQVFGPGAYTVNVSLGKTFQIHERVKLELRGDWLNAFNHVNYSSPVTSISSPIFGAVTSDIGPRTGQINARLTF
ncbi:MAG TPA: TonB-dependent receptor [Bryobacteraceae bacterium]|nr:TonB-dependent receptor [Bryobacteraceae bacterium]